MTSMHNSAGLHLDTIVRDGMTDIDLDQRERLLNSDTDGSDSNESEKEYTVEEAVDAMGFGWFQVKISLIAGFNTMADAFEIMLLSVLSDKLMCEWKLLLWQKALITTCVFGGYFFAAPVWGLMADKYGRRTVLVLSSVYIFYFGLLSSFSPNLLWMLILRGLVGVSLGGATQSGIICAEFLPSKSRGICLTCLLAFWVAGVCLEILLALVVMPTLGWRYLLLFSSFPLAIFLILVRWLPESMLYQQAAGNLSGAMVTLKQISRMNKMPLPPGRLKRKVELKPRGSVRELFKSKVLTVSTCLLIVLWFCNAFLYYGNVLLSAELFSSGKTCVSEHEPEIECFAKCQTLGRDGYTRLLVTSLAELPGILATLLLIDVVGRKLTMGVEMFVAGIVTFLLLLCTSSHVQVIFVFIARAMIGGAFQTIYVYTPELFPTHVRSVGMGICIASSRMGAIVTPFVAQVMIKSSVQATICVYGGFTLLAVLVSILLPIETKGRILK